MIDGINSISSNAIEGAGITGNPMATIEASRDESAKQEFMAVFYKEILKQVFKTPNFSAGDENDKSVFSSSLSTFYSDAMVEQIAKDWVKEGYIPLDMLGKNR